MVNGVEWLPASEWLVPIGSRHLRLIAAGVEGAAGEEGVAAEEFLLLSELLRPTSIRLPASDGHTNKGPMPLEIDHTTRDSNAAVH
jgi:hypothetical protein